MIGSPTTSERLASRAINNSNDDTGISTYGPRRKLIMSSPAAKRKLYSMDDMCIMRKELDLSTRGTLTLARNLRLASGSRHIIESNLRPNMEVKNHKLDDFFVHDYLLFNREDKDSKKVVNYKEHAIIANNICGLIDKIFEERGLDGENALLRIGLDGGGGFLKVCMSVFDLRGSFSNTKTLSKKFKDSGVKKVFLIGITPNVPENYINMKKLWMEIGLHRLNRNFTIATDLKLCNILLGLMSHSSMHPCCWCDVDKYNLDKKGQQRTFDSLSKKNWNYRLANTTKAKAKNFGNAIHPSIIDCDDYNVPVIQFVPPPELHLLLGPTNHMYDELSKLWPESSVWSNSCYVHKTEYHGGCFEGNDCRKLLKNVNLLQERCPDEFRMFANTFSLFNEVVVACFGDKLEENYKEAIADFTEAYMHLKISVTPKVHAVMFHVEEFCSMTGKGLGPWSEQTSESLHREFTKCWDNFLVKDSDNPRYGKKLLQAVHMFNSLNL